jgi:murein DD-endopeptidase MepM/ murein hydrolase activator NlpD
MNNMEILYPCDPVYITQHYGAKSPAYLTYHHGTDFRIRNVPQKAIKCVSDGIVQTVHISTAEPWYTNGVKNENYGKGSPYGVHITVYHKIDGEVYYTLYGHLERAFVNAGDEVKAGQIIAQGGSTGKSTADHLHFELRKGGNSYLKAINAEPFFVESFELPEWGREAWEWGKEKKILSDKSVFDAPLSKGEFIVLLKRYDKTK